jgi:PAS domain S-box-containing protein
MAPSHLGASESQAPPPDADVHRGSLATPERLAAVRATGLLDDGGNPLLDRLARLAARLLSAPLARVSLVTDRAYCFAGTSEIDARDARSRTAPLSWSLCRHVVTSGAPLEVADVRRHPLTQDGVGLTDAGVVAYLGVPLTNADGSVLGALCAIEHRPRAWADADRETLADLAAAVESELARCATTLRFRLAVDATQEVIYAHDCATGLVVREGAVEAIYGRSARELAPTDDDWLALVYVDDRERVAASWQAALAGGAPRWQCEYRMQRPDGRIVIVRDQARILADAEGRPQHVAGAVTDVTGQTVMAEALRASEQRARTMLETALEGICTVDEGGTITYANPRLALMLGRAAGSLVGKSLFALVAPGAEADARACFAGLRGGGRDSREMPLLCADGAVCWTRQAACALESTAGRFGGAWYLLSDLTERMAAERALRESEARLRLALDVAGMSVWEFAVANERSGALAAPRDVGRADDFGSQIQFLVGVHPEDRDRLERATAAAVAQRGEFRVEYRITAPDGAQRWIHAAGGVAQSDEGAATRLVGVTLDVTERVRLEEQLRQAQKMEAVGQLAGGIAHDFNNLLTVISGNLELAQSELPSELPADHPVHTDLQEIADAASRARSLVRQLLTFSRKQTIHPQRVRLGELVRGAERLLRRLIGEEIELVVSVDDGGSMVDADPGQLEQVLMNLAVNARDAMLTARHGHPGRGGTLGIATERVQLTARDAESWPPLHAGPYLRLTVRDTGHGIDAATLAHLFEPFFTTKAIGAGTGLGLATVFGIVRQAGGAVRVDSAPGQGAAFTILLPVVEDGDAAIADPVARPLLARQVARVLLVEDEDPVRHTMRRILERHGYGVVEARNGAEALELWRVERATIDAVVSDLRMPEMGGRELAARLRAESPSLPVVYVSGYAEQPAAGQAGLADAFVEKPFAAQTLLAALDAVLTSSATRTR